VKRSTSATVKALNKDGNEFVMPGRGLLAQIFQHEIDHLNGILFIDKATAVQDIPPSN
jgi:peptide deformylase